MRSDAVASRQKEQRRRQQTRARRLPFRTRAVAPCRPSGGDRRLRTQRRRALLLDAYTGHGACAAALLGDRWLACAQGRSAGSGSARASALRGSDSSGGRCPASRVTFINAWIGCSRAVAAAASSSETISSAPAVAVGRRIGGAGIRGFPHHQSSVRTDGTPFGTVDPWSLRTHLGSTGGIHRCSSHARRKINP